MNSDRRWTQTCITDLRARLLLGEAGEELAAHLDRTAADVARMMDRLRLVSRSTSH